MSKHNRKISVVGLGYVGLPVAVEFGKTQRVVGFDINSVRVDELKQGIERTNEVELDELASADILFTCDPADLKRADFHIIAVPTPVNQAKQPDLTPVISASRTVGRQLKKGDIVVYESTVYPGATEEDCIPVLEQESGLRWGEDFNVGYSPERINPGDKVHTFKTITKVVSGDTPETLACVAAVYESVVVAGVHKAATIKVAEAAKVIENTQRDLNISLMNELALIFNKMNIDTRDVLAAASSKWNFLPFDPGLVGGHCIGVDPYYLTYKAAVLGYSPQVILAGRSINDSMGSFIAAQTVKELIKKGVTVKGSVVTVLGFTFKENVPDIRNTRVIDIVNELQDYGIHVQVFDPMSDTHEVFEEYGLELVGSEEDLKVAQALIFAVPHKYFLDKNWSYLTGLLDNNSGVVIDVKAKLDRGNVPNGVTLWRL
ncbi:MAG: nucleotide sugar dehydrogenase [Methylococcaceae bacterium]|nr:nucleotide sugar dehydrogenase [Methylococcaceae bacterium]MDZ4157433.1 nucleotide sugar dehydrogenase [Methylococcales bacterium]MDP2393652.1 nucleotide sugar dehydrogenase [Methylococcaceae bacterium]MDP3020712.1 nucleotide sugar dehydrogenase [Methylococcaceae bacterium]MDP3390459.1 nucleotide sugar dehydrogenase [Methylococcaceae bacterium]